MRKGLVLGNVNAERVAVTEDNVRFFTLMCDIERTVVEIAPPSLVNDDNGGCDVIGAHGS